MEQILGEIDLNELYENIRKNEISESQLEVMDLVDLGIFKEKIIKEKKFDYHSALYCINQSIRNEVFKRLGIYRREVPANIRKDYNTPIYEDFNIIDINQAISKATEQYNQAMQDLRGGI